MINEKYGIDTSWLDIGISERDLFNPMDFVFKDSDQQAIIERLCYVMSQPEYFYFTCKYVLNVEILPFQAVMLKELWDKKYPMIIASRGASKSFTMAIYCILRALLIPKRKVIVVGAAFRQSKVIFGYMETIWREAPVLRDLCDSYSGIVRGVDKYDLNINSSSITCLPLGDGQKIRGQRANDIIADEFACLEAGSLVETLDGFVRIEDFDSHRILTGDRKCPIEYPSKFIKTPLTDVYEVKLQNGYVIRCSENHQIMTLNGWKKPLSIKAGDYIEKSNKLAVFSRSSPPGVNKDLAWLMGILVSEGSITDKKRISITTTDVKLCSKLVNKFGFKFNVVDGYVDDRGWTCKQAYKLYLDDEEFRSELYGLGLDYVTSHNKVVPASILRSKKSDILAFLCGLFDGDGSCFLWKDREVEDKIGLAYYSVSERLCRDVQFLAERLGYDGYINNRPSDISDNLQWFVRWNNNYAKDFALELKVDRFELTIENCVTTPEPSYITWDKSRGLWKVQYNLLGKAIQKRFKNKADAEGLVISLKNRDNYRSVVSVTKLDKQQHLYDYYLPITNSFYAEGHRQHNSIPRDIFERVVAGFTTVASNPVSKVKARARKKLNQGQAALTEDDIFKDNQITLAGTAYYDFNHFAEYWKNYRKWIYTKGDEHQLMEALGGPIKKGFNWDDYSILRVPVDMLPEGLMDDGIVARAEATVHSGVYDMEYGAIFTSDSQGFFKRTLIESCVVSPGKPVLLPSGPVVFDAQLFGDKKKKYVYGVDPASEVDHFSIVILEKHSDHRRVVYCWTTNRKQHTDKVRANLTVETDFYSYCARKIRDLMKVFPAEEIALDAQGGGIAVMEALHDKDKIEYGEHAIWPIIDPDKPQDTDDQAGLHLLNMCQFSRGDWLSEANHGLRKDMEDKVLLFPFFDTVTLGISGELDSISGLTYDTLEDCVMDIEELKDELSLIVITQTPSGRERWDTPSSKVGIAKVERLRKDRYSALLMANMSARKEQKVSPFDGYAVTGGFAQRMEVSEDTGEKSYDGPAWWDANIADMY